MTPSALPPHRPSHNFVDPLHPPLVLGLLRASLWLDESTRLMLEARDLPSVSRPQAVLLSHIAGGERRAVRIARKLGVTRQSVSVLINELVSKGIITVGRDPDDARAQLLDFSPVHAAQGGQLLKIFERLEELVGNLVGQDRLAVLRQTLIMEWGEPTALENLQTT